MCFMPQRRALFRHPQCQNCSGREVFFITIACNFWSPIFPDGSAPAALASVLATKQCKNTVVRVFCDVSIFRAPAPAFFWLFFASDLFSPPFLFSDSSHVCCLVLSVNSILSEVWRRNFFRIFAGMGLNHVQRPSGKLRHVMLIVPSLPMSPWHRCANRKMMNGIFKR